MITGKKYFLNVTKGAFSEKLVPGQLTNLFSEVTGHLVNINFKETNYGTAMRLHVVSEQNFYVLSMFVDSRAGNAFFMLAKNILFNAEMTFKMKSFEGRDYFAIHQFGGPVLWYYSNENSNLLPASKEDRKAFFLKMIETEILPAIERNANPYPNHSYYKPMRKGLQGGYFDAYKSKGRVIGPVSYEERNGK